MEYSRMAAESPSDRLCPLESIGSAMMLSDVLACVASSNHPRQVEICRSITSLARHLGRAPDGLPADMATLRKLFPQLQIPPARLSRKRVQNLRALVKTGLRIAGVLDDDLPALPTAGGWAEVMEGVQGRPMVSGISRFIRYCVREGLEPHDIDGTVLLRFESWLDGSSLSKDPRRVARTAAWAWNRLMPERHISLPRKDPKAAVLADLPASLAADIERYVAARGLPPALVDALLIDDPHARLLARIQLQVEHATTDARGRRRSIRPLRDDTLKQHQWLLRCLAGYAAKCLGRHPTCIRELLTADIVFAWALFEGAEAEALKTGTLASRVGAFHDIAVRSGASDTDIQHLAFLRSDLKARSPEISESVAAKVAQFDDPAILRQVLALPERIASAVEARRRSDTLKRGDVLDMQVAVIIAILFCSPLRRKSLASLEVAPVQAALTSKGSPLVHIDAKHVKTGIPVVFELDAPAQRLLRLYLAHYRPRLMPDGALDGGALLPSADGRGAKSRLMITHLVKSRLQRWLRVDGGPHIFRYICAALLFEATGSVSLVQALLTHTGQSDVWQGYVLNAQRVASQKLRQAREAEGAPRRRHQRRPLRPVRL